MKHQTLSVLSVGIMLLVTAPFAAAQTDAPLLRAADAICAAPPFDARTRSLVRRARGYDHMLDALVDRCPDVAMIFAEFSVGATPASGPRSLLDCLWMLNFPANRVTTENQ